MAEAEESLQKHTNAPSRRDFLVLTTATMGAVGAAGFIWPFIDSMNPAADVLALSTVDVNLAPIAEGQSITVMWQGKPVFIRHRTEAEITKERSVALAELKDPQTDEERTKANPKYLIVVGVCTHLGCVPLGQKSSEPRGKWGGWYCPCHGSEYDISGRIRKGPAPINLPVPDFTFLTDSMIRIGVKPDPNKKPQDPTKNPSSSEAPTSENKETSSPAKGKSAVPAKPSSPKVSEKKKA